MSGRDLLNRLGPLLGLAAVILFFTLAVWAREGANKFATVDNLQTITLQSAVVGAAALGMTMIIIAGGIDLSMGSLAALTSVVTALLLKNGGWAAVPAALGGVLAGGFCGAVTGLLVTGLRLVPFIATLGMMLILRGVAKEFADNKTVNPPSGALDTILEQTPFMPVGFWILVGLAVGVALLLRYTRFGRHLFAIGSNEPAARLCGIPIARTKIAVYTLGGLFAGVSGVFLFARLAQGNPTAAVGLELDVVAAVVIGGGSLSGGEGSVLGSLVGALIMSAIRNGCSLMGWANSRTEIVAGAIILAAVALDRLRHRRAA